MSESPGTFCCKKKKEEKKENTNKFAERKKNGKVLYKQDEYATKSKS